MTHIERGSLALLTDLYQLTMAYGYWKAGTAQREAVFHLFYRQQPFQGGFAIASGLEAALDFVAGFRFAPDDLAYLATLRGNDSGPLFEPEFLRLLERLELTCDLDAIPEGTVVFPQEPLVRVRGPMLQCQLLETPLLNLLNFSTLIATKAARICLAAKGEPVIEFGLRRAQGVDGGLSASRAAYVGGCAGTSNVLAGKLHGIPVLGTHAHSWVMSFDSELESFHEYARAMPNNCVFLVDTFDTLDGVRHAIEVGRSLREQGHELVGIRLDSGDLAYLSIEARKLLDEAGFPRAIIVASNDLDEHVIASLKEQGAAIDTWGVGTRLATAYDQPALGGVYKLAAIRRPSGEWHYALKLSEQAAKISTPGIHQVRRYEDSKGYQADMIYDVELGVPERPTLVDPFDATRRTPIAAGTAWRDLLVPVVRGGKRTYASPPLGEVRAFAQRELSRFPVGIKRFLNPHLYPVGLEAGLFDLKQRLVVRARERVGQRAEKGRPS